MEPIQTNNEQQAPKAATQYINFTGWYYSKDRKKIFLTLPGGITVPLHVNFAKARLNIPYTPELRKEKPAA